MTAETAPGLPAELEAAIDAYWRGTRESMSTGYPGHQDAALAELIAKLMAWRKAAYLAGFKAGSGDDCYDEAML